MVSPYLGIFYNKYSKNNDNANRNIIRYRYSESSPSTAVWVANRNNPIPDVYGNLKIDVDGKLSILSSEVTVLDLFSPSQVTRNASVRLLDSGNLVVQELYPDGSIKELPADGSFTLTAGDLNGKGQMVILRQKNVHWKSGPWRNGQFNNEYFPGPDVRLYYVSNETEESFTYLTKTYDSFPALTMQQDGHLESTALNFDVHCRSIGNPPDCAEDELEKLKCRDRYRAGCKTYGKRIYNPDEADRDRYYSIIELYPGAPDKYLASANINGVCSVNDPGCAENEFENIECRKDYHFRKVSGYIYGDKYEYEESYNLTIYDCKRICWSNCSCVAYTYANKNKADCKTFGQMIYNPSENEPEDSEYYAFVLPDSDEALRRPYPLGPHDTEVGMEKNKWIWLIIGIGSLASILSCYLLNKKLDARVLLVQMVNRKRQEDHKTAAASNEILLQLLQTNKNLTGEVHYFTFQSISTATNNFSSTNKLGEGGFGEVYKAWELWNEGRGLELMDPVLEDSCTPKEVMTCIHVGLLCVQEHAMDRPTMSEVISMLTNENMHLPEPKRPAFFIKRCEVEAARDDNLGNGSVNGQSISIVVAR
ncbi:Apple-like protein [Artemisia annua]|uniref:Apple-like protein n=1 Tax=Artemisia annua TaxID=35608 RepID=A0A2U1MXT3_ARTAN|nr:Apple-like protein [Artemisia annua]